MKVEGSHNLFKSRKQRWPVAGRLRGGRMILTPAAKEAIPDAQSLYDDGVEMGMSFDDIAKALKKAKPDFKRSPMRPENLPYFRLFGGDFATPGDDTRIIELYGEERNAKEGKQVYRLPVLLPSDNIDDVLEQEFATFKGNHKVFWSDGNGPCMERAKLAVGGRKRWGGVAGEVRKEFCNPDECEEFNSEECKHHGTLRFHIPGIKGLGVFELPFTSITTGFAVRNVLEVMQMGLGRIRGKFDGEPMFYLSKVRKSIRRIDWKKGQELTSDQYIVQLEASGIDMGDIYDQEQTKQLAPPDSTYIKAESETATVTIEEKREPTITIEAAPEPTIPQLRADISAMAKTLGISGKQIGTWGTEKYGEDAFKDVGKLASMKADIAAVSENGGDLSEFIGSEAPF